MMKKKKLSNPKEFWESFIDSELNKLVKKDTIFREQPVSPKEFFEVWMNNPLFPLQLRIVESLFDKHLKWSTEYNEYILMYGEGSGKDYTISRLLTYVCYWLLCLENPQQYFNLGKGSPIDVVNVSVNARHANEVFFTQFVTALRMVRNPVTGKNWFEERGVDLREGRDILKASVKFPNNITTHSLNSVRYAGEGKNILIGIFDEVGEFSYEKAQMLYENLKNTAISRFRDKYKIILISYPRDLNDFMYTLYKRSKDTPKVFRDRKAPWEVRSPEGAHPHLIQIRAYRLKEDYADAYSKNPLEAKRRYECIIDEALASKYIKDFDVVLKRCVKFDRPFPYRPNEPWCTDKELINLIWEPWFRPYYTYEIWKLEQECSKNPDDLLKKRIELELTKHKSPYFMHLDLAKGTYYFAGLSLIHPFRIAENITGFYIDFIVQIRPSEKELNFEYIKQFIFKLLGKGFPIKKITFDGYESHYFKTMLMAKHIDTGLLSVDRTTTPYNTFKEYLYQGLVNIYPNTIFLRELNELVVTPKGSVDHPDESLRRLKEEGFKRGSKDLADAVCGAIYSASLESEISKQVIIKPVEEVDKFEELFGDKGNSLFI
ncbi:MAG: hypothetical protein ACTSYR_02135 [Candidatus Odinarchaeia archaeon]